MSIDFTKLEHNVAESSSDSSSDSPTTKESKFLSTPDPDLPPPLTSAEKAEKEMIETIIELYRENFKNVKIDEINGLSLEELRETKKRLDKIISASPAVDAWERMFWVAMVAVEGMIVAANFDITGWADACYADPTIKADIKFLIINYAGRLAPRPELRVGLAMFGKGALMYKCNNELKLRNKAQNTSNDNKTSEPQLKEFNISSENVTK